MRRTAVRAALATALAAGALAGAAPAATADERCPGIVVISHIWCPPGCDRYVYVPLFTTAVCLAALK